MAEQKVTTETYIKALKQTNFNKKQCHESKLQIKINYILGVKKTIGNIC